MVLEERLPITSALLPLKQNVAGQIALVGAATLVIALLAQVVIAVPGDPVPITGQTLAVLLVGAALGSRLGALSVLAYLGEGALGLPVFAGAQAGLPVGPTGGYLIGFVAMAFVVGWLAERGWDRSPGRAFLAMVAGELVLYLFGLCWLHFYVGWGRVLALGFWPFVAGDLAKMVIASALFPVAWKFVGSRPSLKR